MPIEVKELHIKASVNQDGNNSHTPASESTLKGSEKDSLIQLCVEKVLDILKEKQER